MADENIKKPFALAPGRTTFTMRDVENVRDQDNVKPMPQPPRIFQLDHPRLAPPGMKGINRTVRANQNVDININLNVRFEQPAPPKRDPLSQPAKARVQLGDHNHAKREFKPLTDGKDVSRRR